MEQDPLSKSVCQDDPLALSWGNLGEDLRLSDSLQTRMNDLGLDVSGVCRLYAKYLDEEKGDKTATPRRVRKTVQRILAGEGTNIFTWIDLVKSLGGDIQVRWKIERQVIVEDVVTHELD
jgi:hypothetical protein